MFGYLSGIKNLPFDPVFSKQVNLIKKVSIIICYRNSLNCKFFFCKIESFKFFKNEVIVFCFLVFDHSFPIARWFVCLFVIHFSKNVVDSA